MPVIETNSNGREVLSSGVYRHPDTGEELVAQGNSKFGNPQADAITRLGFQYVGPVNTHKVALAPDPNQGPIANTDPGDRRSVGELEAELAAAKEREKQLQDSLSDKSSLVKSDKPEAPAKNTSKEGGTK